jgi:hypothetical protein
LRDAGYPGGQEAFDLALDAKFRLLRKIVATWPNVKDVDDQARNLMPLSYDFYIRSLAKEAGISK